MDSKKIGEALAIYKNFLECMDIPVNKHLDDELELGNDSVLAHSHWMAIEAESFLAQDRREKAMRWLCFIQGCLFTLGYFRINEIKDHNRPDGPSQEQETA